MQSRQSSKSADLVSGLALAVLGGYIIVQTRRWEYAGPDGPGPGFFPLWYGVAMVALSGALVVFNALKQRSLDACGAREGARPGVPWRKVGRALSTWLALGVAVASSAWIGLISSLALLTFFIVAVIYRRPLRVAAAVGVLLAAGFYLAFPVALGVSLPTGPFGF